MKVLLIGAGGREHALAWALAQSENCAELYCAPGNAGTESCAESVDIAADDIESLTNFAAEKSIDLVVVGPEKPLVMGLADSLREKGIAVFGPSAAAARLEGSKSFTKDICKDYNIPTAQYERFSNLEDARAYIENHSVPLVLKADGLAAGKGVSICQSREEALAEAADMLSGNKFGDAGQEIVVEEYLEGEELSYFALCDGHVILPFGSAQDHKRVGEGDTGPNTGGMGAYSPARLITPELEQKIHERILEPTIKAMLDKGCPFTGVLYAGLMIVDGEPHLIEYNVRFGDPECQVLMVRLQSDLLAILNAAAQERLSEMHNQVVWRDDPAMTVIMAARGYPASYARGEVISGLQDTYQVEDLTVFHSGTARNETQDFISNGGRVLSVTATGIDLREARGKVYRALRMIDWPGGFYREDIGWRALEDLAA